MNVNLVQLNPPGIGRQTPDAKPSAATAPRSADSNGSPKPETSGAQNNPVPFLIPEHEVKVQWDTPADHIMIYRVLNKQSGALVLQVPSAEGLSGMHRTQELLERIASRGRVPAAAPVVKEKEQEGNTHGNKL